MNGDKKTGVGIMAMEEGLDTGSILIEEEPNISIHLNKESLEKKLIEISSKLIIQALEIISNIKEPNRININNHLNLVKQSDMKREISYANLIKKEEITKERKQSWQAIQNIRTLTREHFIQKGYLSLEFDTKSI